MEPRIIDGQALLLMRLFENVTGARVRDVVVAADVKPPKVVFVVDPGEVQRAVGPKGDNVRKLRERLDHDVMIVQFDPSPAGFVRSLFRGFELEQVEVVPGAEGRSVVRVKAAEDDKGRLIGKGGQNLALARRVLARHHDSTIKVL